METLISTKTFRTPVALQICDLVKKSREHEGLSRNRLAELADISVPTLINMEMGKVCTTIYNVERVTRAMNLSFGLMSCMAEASGDKSFPVQLSLEMFWAYRVPRIG